MEAGISVVILAIFLDRVTAALGTPGKHPGSLLSLLRRRSGGRGPVLEAEDAAEDAVATAPPKHLPIPNL